MIRKKPNQDIRDVVKISGFFAYEVDEKLGCSENSYYRLLRKPLDEDDRQAIFKALEQLKVEREKGDF